MEPANTLGAYDAKTRFSEILERVAGGEEFTITRHGSPVAKLVPVKKQTTVKERRMAIERMQKASERRTLGGLKIKDLINEGRP
jgi:prevent-host-death family protein